ncbi:MAG: hypothetical protein O7C65_10825, partial [Planctomycetota bacterium]|nr:hypothetical protein [Planctomycetota bacterium]
YFPIQCSNRQRLLAWLMHQKRDVAAQHLRNCADLPGFSPFYRDCPQARKTADQVVLLPTYPRYPMSEVEKNIDAIRSYFAVEGDDATAQSGNEHQPSPARVGRRGTREE